MSTGINNKIAIIGMGCTKFGERWDASGEDLIVEAFRECLADAGIEKKASKCVKKRRLNSEKSGFPTGKTAARRTASSSPRSPKPSISASPAKRAIPG